MKTEAEMEEEKYEEEDEEEEDAEEEEWENEETQTILPHDCPVLTPVLTNMI